MGAVAAPNAEQPPEPSSPRRDSLCSSPGLGSGSLPPDSLQAAPVLDSPSIQCDSLECSPCRCCGSPGSPGLSQDSLQGPVPRRSGRGRSGARPPSSDLSGSLESLIQLDSLQSLCSLCVSSSRISGDSLESLSSLSLGASSQHSDLEFMGP
ncbi:hypothetical protein WISP_142666 [Willisornis vidua]|uniref:Uncharacterized protein n=1 Tax=Willisornis vidua TaxID=1566151 RepID=A0ABQ9CRJ6_9PASS|nr:hypothetical protein WISP_142666 [Willisornis vidua]